MNTKEDSKQDESTESGAANFVAIEHEVLDYWKAARSFEKLAELRRGKPLFRFLDGPITANNPMGVHHAWGRTLKDIFIRYKCTQDFDCHFQNGFDCQGLWVEVEVERELGFRGKPDIESYGLDKFSEACKKRIDKFSKIQTNQSIRLGQWMDWDNSYFTHTDRNIEGIWRFLKKCNENGWLYQSHSPMPWCTRCGTSLSEHEMAGSYADLKHLAVYIKILIPALNTRVLVWTTTPWTLPANTGLAVNPGLDYSLVKVEGEDLPLLLSSQVAANWSSGGWKARSPQVIKTLKGRELVDLDYEPIFHDLPVQQNFRHRVVAWDAVDPSEGTGVVHIAPGCGREDFELSKTAALERLIPVDEKGDYVAGYGGLTGKNAKQVADEVAKWLAGNAKLYSKYEHEHSYPVCWRCKDELIFRLVDEWYISSKEVRPLLIEASRDVKWQPEHVGKRMEDWLRNMGDWCISRKRFWGLPLPFYCCGNCSHLTVVGSREELQALTSQDVSKVKELHRPWIDEIEINCPKCSKPAKRVIEVGDCWLDAGIVPYSTDACYARNSDGTRAQGDPTKWQQADWICEMSEQVRLWFYSMLFMGVTLGGKAPYRHVLTYERVRAEDGTKFSKTGYMIKFDEAAERMGVDAMRYYFASQPPTGDIRFGFLQGDETRRQLISIWNIFGFFQTYASIDTPVIAPVSISPPALQPIDKWLLASIAVFIEMAQRAYENYDTPDVIEACEKFIDGLSNWYIRSNRRRFWKSGSDLEKSAGYWTLFQALRAICQAMSPIMPFLTERAWQQCIRAYDPSAAESVHHALWNQSFPQKILESWRDQGLVDEVAKVRQIITLAHKLRTESKVKVRQPLQTLFIHAPEAFLLAARKFQDSILAELNIKDIAVIDSPDELSEEYLELDLKKAGPVLKTAVGQVVQIVNSLNSEQSKLCLEAVRSGTPINLPGWPEELPAGIFVIKKKVRSNLACGSEQNLLLGLDLRIDAELEEEGWMRDLLRQSQLLRKDSGLDVQDRILLKIDTASPEINSAVEKHRSLIECETLGVIAASPLPKPAGQCEFFLGNQTRGGLVKLALAKRD